ncbi:MAG: 4Fe-4S ferredoxin [Candidatus Ratteibacteria bacterium]
MKQNNHLFEGCPVSGMMDSNEKKSQGDETDKKVCELRQWPIQLYLVPPQAPYYKKTDVLLSTDYVVYTVGDFHKDYLKEKALAIVGPKLDEGRDIYVEKIKSLIDDVKENTIIAMIMHVSCCFGLINLVQGVACEVKRKIFIKSIAVSLQRNIIKGWI